MTFPDRILYLINASGETKKAFASMCSITESQLFNILNSKNLPGTAFYSSLKEKFPWVNLDWLITGEGEPRLFQPDKDNVIPIDMAVEIIREVEEEEGVTLTTRQREEVAKVLRKEIERRNRETKEMSKSEISSLVTAFKGEGDEG